MTPNFFSFVATFPYVCLGVSHTYLLYHHRSHYFIIYLNFYNSYSVTYGSLGAVIILLTWFYITGLMLLVGAEINSEIEAAAAERKVNQASPAADPGSPDWPAPGSSAAAD